MSEEKVKVIIKYGREGAIHIREEDKPKVTVKKFSE